jgi:3-methyladenine DNA glycosylase AlkD
LVHAHSLEVFAECPTNELRPANAGASGSLIHSRRSSASITIRIVSIGIRILFCVIVRLSDLKKELRASADPERARNLAWFFKTGKGQYGHGDRFIGLTVPVARRIAHRYIHLPLTDVAKLLASPIHEHRFVALEILVAQYERGNEKAVFDFYLKHTKFVNNWDLVDTSAPYIVGQHLLTRPRKILYRLAKSNSIWERRIAIVSTMMFIRAGEIEDTFAIAKLLLTDDHDLIHKAVGWMLREAGKQSAPALLGFLKENYSALPRTTLRYAIERFPASRRKRLLAG